MTSYIDIVVLHFGGYTILGLAIEKIADIKQNLLPQAKSKMSVHNNGLGSSSRDFNR
jgi:hypothetical protein